LVVIRIDPPAVAIGHQPEEQAGLGPVHGLEAERVDDQQRGVEVFLAPEPKPGP